MSKSIAEVASETRVLVGPLSRMKPGDVLEYVTIKEQTGIDVQQPANRGYMATARRIAERDYGIVVDCLPTVGFRRLDADTLRLVGDGALQKNRRVAKRAIRSMSAGAEKLEMSADARVMISSRTSLLALSIEASKTKMLESAEAAVKASGNGEMSIGKTLRLFGK